MFANPNFKFCSISVETVQHLSHEDENSANRNDIAVTETIQNSFHEDSADRNDIAVLENVQRLEQKLIHFTAIV